MLLRCGKELIGSQGRSLDVVSVLFVTFRGLCPRLLQRAVDVGQREDGTARTFASFRRDERIILGMAWKRFIVKSV